ncbi:MAG: hydrogenase-4 component G [Proteobacteria bacterium]|nr:hydrogenase-4 component G [Pseudomonadota bacterium]
MVQTSSIQSFSLNFQYASYEQKNISIQSGDDKTVFDASITREKAFQFTLDIQLSTYRQINDQAKPFIKYQSGNSASYAAKNQQHASNDQKNSLDLFEKDGYWGIEKTAQRIVDFVFKGTGDDIEKLKAGREGVKRGLKEAEKAWGGTLPDISYDTIKKTLETIDEKIHDLNGRIIDMVT